MPFASLQPSVIDDYLYTELAKGRVAVPFSSPPIPHHHISFFFSHPRKTPARQMALDSGSC